MTKIVACTLIIKDDFNNVLILKRKAKRGQEETWSLLTQKLRGKESDEKCLNRAIKDVFKSIIFNLEEFKEYDLDQEEGEGIKVYLGDLKERFILDKSYDEAKWISKNDLDKYNIEELHRNILKDFYR